MAVISSSRAVHMTETDFDLRNEPVTFDDLKGMKVVDTDGEKFGTVQEILLDPINLDITGLVVRKGFKSVFLQKDLVERIGRNCVMLKVPPVIESMEVIDINGEKVGKVRQVFKNGSTNDVELIEVSTGFASRPLKVPQHEIHGIGKKVVLKHTKEEYEKNTILE
jgi:sporulation protein YlmC with PRC-barrel domain